MAETAPQIQYRQEMIASFEVGQSLLRDTVTTEAVIKGNQATFLVAGSGGAEANTRGVNGLIPARGDDLTQTTVTLVEWHDLVRKTRFNIFQSQGDQRSLMQRTTMEVMNRRIDDDIITELNTATTTLGSATTASLELSVHALTALQNNDVPWDGNVFGLITPAYNGYLSQIPEYASADYVDLRPLPSGGNTYANMPKVKNWLGVNWIVHPNLPGVGTSAEVCFMFHKSAIGHAVDTGAMNTAIGYDDEQDYSYARCSCFLGTELLQTSGVIKINHDGSAFATS